MGGEEITSLYLQKGGEGKQGIVQCCLEHFQGVDGVLGSVTIHEEMMCTHLIEQWHPWSALNSESSLCEKKPAQLQGVIKNR